MSKILDIVKPREVARKGVPLLEQLLGGLILICLISLGIFIALKGRSFDPDRYALNPAALESTRSEVVGKAGTLRAESSRKLESIPIVQSRRGEMSSVLGGFSPLGATERYDAETLFEKINGRAPVYIEFNFEELTFRSFSLDAQPGQFVDVYVYRMDSALNAFGIFSMERESGAEAVDFVEDGYRSAMGFFFRQGAAYVQLIASDSSPQVMEAVEGFARAFADSLPKDNTGIEARAMLPADNKIQGSTSYIQKNAYGLSALVNVFEAKYRVGSNEIKFFVMAAADNNIAVEAWDAVGDFQKEYAAVKDSGEISGASYLVVDDFGEWHVYFLRGQQLCGVIGAKNREVAFSFVKEALGLEEGEETEYE